MNLKAILPALIGSLVVGCTVLFYVVWTQGDTLDDAKEDQTALGMQYLGEKLLKFAQDNGGFPYTEEGIDALLTKPDQDVNWKGPYLELNRLRDPWDTAFAYESNGITFKLTSAAQDRRFGTDDDITLPSAPSPN